jgi:hypothetical protein
MITENNGAKKRSPCYEFIEDIFENGFSDSTIERFKDHFQLFMIILNVPGKYIELVSVNGYALYLDFEREKNWNGGHFPVTDKPFAPVLALCEYKDYFPYFRVVEDKRNNKLREECDQ